MIAKPNNAKSASTPISKGLLASFSFIQLYNFSPIHASIAAYSIWEEDSVNASQLLVETRVGLLSSTPRNLSASFFKPTPSALPIPSFPANICVSSLPAQHMPVSRFSLAMSCEIPLPTFLISGFFRTSFSNFGMVDMWWMWATKTEFAVASCNTAVLFSTPPCIFFLNCGFHSMSIPRASTPSLSITLFRSQASTSTGSLV